MAIINKSKILENMSDEELKAGYIKFNIPDPEKPYSLNGEGIWGWIDPDDKKNKYDNDDYQGTMMALICNAPINDYYGLLYWGAEVQIKCHGEDRPTLDPDWMKLQIAEAMEKNKEETDEQT